MLRVYCDGASRNNGRRHCQAAAAVFFADHDPRNYAWRLVEKPSNQRAELSAIQHAVRILQEPAVIVTDSMYAIKCLTVWHKQWARNGWLTKDQKPVLNTDLIRPILDDLKCKTVMFHHIRAHQKRPTDSALLADWYGNHRADWMARNVLNTSPPGSPGVSTGSSGSSGSSGTLDIRGVQSTMGHVESKVINVMTVALAK